MPYNVARAGSFSTYMTYSPAWNGDNVRRPGHAFGALGRENEPVKGRCVHSGHLDFVRGRQSTVCDSDERIVGRSTLTLGDAIAELPATIPFTTSAGCGA